MNPSPAPDTGPDTDPVSTAAPPPPSTADVEVVARTVPVAPGTTGVTQAQPDWVPPLTAAYLSIASRAHDYASLMDTRRKLQYGGNQELQRLHVLKAVVQLTIDHPSQAPLLHTSEIGSLNKLASALEDLSKAAADPMFNKVFETISPALASQADNLGNGILASIHDAQFLALVKKLAATVNPKNGTTPYLTTFNGVSDALAYAYLVLYDSPLQEKVNDDFAPAAAYLTGLGKSLVDPGGMAAIAAADAALADALNGISPSGPPDDVLGVLVTAMGLPSMVIGNVAGPNTLLVAVLRWQGAQQGKDYIQLVSDANTAASMAKFAANDLALAASVLPRSDQERKAIVDMAVKIVNGEGSPTVDSDYLANIDARLSSRMSSVPWLWGVGVLNAALLFVSGYHCYKVGLTPSNVVSATGSVAGLVATGATALRLLGMIGARAVAVVGKAVGGVGVILAGAQLVMAIQKGDAKDIVLGGVSLAGMALLEASLFLGPAGAGLAIIGGGLVIGSTIISIVTDDSFKDLFRSAPEVWWLGMEKAFESGATYCQAVPNNGGLAAKASALRDAITNTSFLLIDVSQSAALSQLVDADGQKALLASP